MAKSLYTIAVFMLVCGLAQPVQAQKAKQVALAPETQKCLLEHQQKYHDAPRALIIFTPEYCPALSREEVLKAANAAQNSGSGEKRAFKRVILKKPQFACLVARIAAHREALPEHQDEPDDALEFTLDCETAQ